MHSLKKIHPSDVQSVYSGAEGDLWELVMGHQIHVGGFASSNDLAEKAGIAAGSRGVDLCCCNGAGMRHLLRFCGVGHMTGVDFTPRMIALGRARSEEEGFSGSTTFVEADVTRTGLPAHAFDFVWGEDAWCYVENKPALIAEAARLVRPGGTVAFTDWVEGPAAMSPAEADRLNTFMKFPTLASLPDYTALLSKNGLAVAKAENTRRFAPCVDLYLQMLSCQLTSDALRIIHYDMALFQALAGEMTFIQQLAHAGKIIQALLVAHKV